MGDKSSAPKLNRRISRRSVCDTIDAAEKPFRQCWQTLLQVRGSQVGPDFVGDVLGFQFTLIEALSQLENQRVAIKHEERRLIREKARCQPAWFAKRMATLKRYREALLQALAIGRALGDGFAWMFYERDRSLIDQHLQQQRQINVPTGVGGLGERTSAKDLKSLADRLMIYHGTTTFLRIGDVSLVDLSTVRVCGIGEMKTERISPEQIEVRIELIADSKVARLLSADMPVAPTLGQRLPPKMQDRFERQKNTMREALKAASQDVAERRIGRQSDFHYDTLDELVKGCDWKRFSYAAPEPSLVMGALRRRRRRSLSGTLLGRVGDMTAKVVGVEQWVVKAMEPPHPQNNIVLGSIGDPESLVLTSEAMPFTLWPAADETIESLLFGEVMVVTLYNPGHFWRAIEDRGFELSLERPGGDIRARRKLGSQIQDLRQYSYFHLLMRRHLMTLPTVMNMVDATLKLTEDPQLQGGLRINVRPQVSRSPHATGIEYDDL